MTNPLSTSPRPRAAHHRSRVAPFGLVGKLTLASALVLGPAFRPSAALRLSAAPQTPAAGPVANLDDPQLAGRFAGRVFGPDDQPLPGARLYVVPAEGKADGPGPVRARTDAAGRFDFDVPDLTTLAPDGLPMRRLGLLIAAADGFAPDLVATWGHATTIRFGGQNDPQPRATFDLRLAPLGPPIRGQVLGPTGAPIAGVPVRLTGLDVPRGRDLDACLKHFAGPDGAFLSFHPDRSIARVELLPGVDHAATTDAAGRFVLAGLGRDHLAKLTVAAPGLVETTADVMTRDAPAVVSFRRAATDPTREILGATCTIQPLPSRPLTGVVVDRATGRPIAGMRVTPTMLVDRWLPLGLQPTLTDQDGRFTVDGIDPRSWADQAVPANGWDRRFRLYASSQPGMPYIRGEVVVDRAADLTIACSRGIPFRLTITDEAGSPVDASVITYTLMPNPLIDPKELGINFDTGPLSPAARRGPGIYEGCVAPGPSSVLVGRVPGFRPAHVDPKRFFAPGRTAWTAQEKISDYGTHESLSAQFHWQPQAHYSAIVLVNPPVDSAPLELRATLLRDHPRSVTLVDPAGQPVVAVETEGLTADPTDAEPRLRVASFPLVGVPPRLNQRIVFTQPDRKLIAFLNTRAEQTTPVAVTLRPWATLTGRLVEPDGQPFDAAEVEAKGFRANISLSIETRYPLGNDDLNPPHRRSTGCSVDVKPDGTFRVDRLVPELRYSARAWRWMGMSLGPAFEELSLEPGEVRDLGDVRTRVPVDVRGK